MAQELIIEPHGKLPAYIIKNPGVGGSLPKTLRGMFTSYKDAEKAINAVRANIRDKAKQPKRRQSGTSEIE